MPENELDLLGELLFQALKFLDSGFDASLVLHDCVTHTDLPAGELFSESNGRWFMRADSVPGDLSLKSIGLDGDALYVETAPFDSKRTLELIYDKMMPLAFNHVSRTFCDVHTGATLVTVSEPVKLEPELGERCLWTMQLKGVSQIGRQVSVKMVDLLYSSDCFILEESGETLAFPTTQRMVQELSLNLQQRLQVEQRPMLSLKVSVQDRTEARTELRTDLRLLFTMERRLVAMTEQELLDFVLEYAAEHGEARVKNVLLFTIAGKIKKAMPDKISWRAARTLAKKMTQVH